MLPVLLGAAYVFAGTSGATYGGLRLWNHLDKPGAKKRAPKPAKKPARKRVKRVELATEAASDEAVNTDIE